MRVQYLQIHQLFNFAWTRRQSVDKAVFRCFKYLNYCSSPGHIFYCEQTGHTKKLQPKHQFVSIVPFAGQCLQSPMASQTTLKSSWQFDSNIQMQGCPLIQKLIRAGRQTVQKMTPVISCRLATQPYFCREY